jgi:predicted glycogen debranching enzyme
MNVIEPGVRWSEGDESWPLLRREWLITNGLGGYGSGTVLGPHTRKYHGLFVPNLSEPNGRHIMLSALDEELQTQDRIVHLGGFEDADGELHTDTHRTAGSFSLAGAVPVWQLTTSEFTFSRRLLMPHHQNLLCARYAVRAASGARLRVRPFFSLRRHDADPGGDPRDRGEYIVKADTAIPLLEVRLEGASVLVRCGLIGGRSTFVSDALEVTHHYRQETVRGYSSNLETHFSPGYFALESGAELDASLVVTTEPLDLVVLDVEALFEAERQRSLGLLETAGVQDDALAARLVIAADQFVIRPGNRAEEIAIAEAGGAVVRTVIAGYHWFGDWGRDTMISLEGLTLSTGRHREAGAILETFAGYVKDGLLPNLFPEGARAALYHTVDATLWFFHAINRYCCVTRDGRLVPQIFPVLESIIQHYLNGTHYGIGVDDRDGLVRAGAPGYQLTWMDAKAGDWVVTPRRGKPVEIQALWYNALCLMKEWTRQYGLPVRFDYGALAQRAKESFNARYWITDGEYLFDVVDGPEGDDCSGRPNQIFAISLPHAVLAPNRWSPVLNYVTTRLLTPFGLRTLSPDHPDYKRNYHGDLLTRDGAYHQGTVWPWLIGHYADAWARVNAPCGPADQNDLLSGFVTHLSDYGMGSIAEIFDAEAPFEARGCIAQAWSVAEVLRTRRNLRL